MRSLSLALVLAVVCLFGASSTSEATGGRAVFISDAGRSVVFVRNQPFVQTVVVRRGLFGLRRSVVVRQAFFGPVFARQFVPGFGFVRVRVH